MKLRFSQSHAIYSVYCIVIFKLSRAACRENTWSAVPIAETQQTHQQQQTGMLSLMQLACCACSRLSSILEGSWGTWLSSHKNTVLSSAQMAESKLVVFVRLPVLAKSDRAISQIGVVAHLLLHN